MANCSVRIELQDGVDHVAPGADLPVTVHVECDTVTKCKGLVLTRLWVTHGRGNRDTGGKRVTQLFEGEWQPGSYSYEAVVPFPGAPRTYHGTNVSVDWFIEARADVPFAFDPKDKVGALVVQSGPPRKVGPPDVWSPSPIQLKGALSGALIPAIVGLVIAAVAAAASHPILASIVGGLSAVLLVKSLMSRHAAKAMGHAALGVHPDEISPGETLWGLVELEPEVAVDVESVTLSLSCEESATSGSGTDSTTYTHEVFSRTTVLGETLRLGGAQRFEEEASFELPEDAPTSFRSNDNGVTYTLALEIQPVGKSALKHSREIQVGGAAEPL